MDALEQQARAMAPRSVPAALRSAAPVAVGIAAALLLHFAVRPIVGPYWRDVLIDVGIGIMLAVSLTIVNGFTGQFSIGHAGFLALGAYAGGAVTYYGSIAIWGDAGFHGGFLSSTQSLAAYRGAWLGPGDLLFVAACLVGGCAAAGAGYLVGLPSLRLRGDYLAIVTLGFGEIIRVLHQQTPAILSPAEAATQPSLRRFLHVGGSTGFSDLVKQTTLFWVGLGVAATLLAAYRLKQSTYGRAFLSIRENLIAAEAVGIPTTRYKVRAFVMSAFFAGVAGVLFAHKLGNNLSPADAGFMKSFEIIIMVVLGGLGSISGAVIAAVALTLLGQYLLNYGTYKMVIYATTLVVVMIVRPQGLLGLREVWELEVVRRWRDRHPPGPGAAAPQTRTETA